MRRKLGCLSLVGFVILLGIGAIPVEAGIRPSFSLDGCSWSATHIVLVQTTAEDGVFSVVESWKGDLKPEASLEIPELKPNKDAVPISSPIHTSLKLTAVNAGDIVVTGVDGELDVNDVNGSVTLNNVSGSAVAHALNGRLLATFSRVNPQKPMAFSSLNGDIDVTFPADLKANLSLKSDRGEIFSDFDVQVQASAPQQIVEDGRGHGGKYLVKIDKAVHGTINGGGPELQFTNFNGGIYIRKAGAAR
jgi:Toastrack DUF4097